MLFHSCAVKLVYVDIIVKFQRYSFEYLDTICCSITERFLNKSSNYNKTALRVSEGKAVPSLLVHSTGDCPNIA